MLYTERYSPSILYTRRAIPSQPHPALLRQRPHLDRAQRRAFTLHVSSPTSRIIIPRNNPRQPFILLPFLLLSANFKVIAEIDAPSSSFQPPVVAPKLRDGVGFDLDSFANGSDGAASTALGADAGGVGASHRAVVARRMTCPRVGVRGGDLQGESGLSAPFTELGAQRAEETTHEEENSGVHDTVCRAEGEAEVADLVSPGTEGRPEHVGGGGSHGDEGCCQRANGELSDPGVGPATQELASDLRRSCTKIYSPTTVQRHSEEQREVEDDDHVE